MPPRPLTSNSYPNPSNPFPILPTKVFGVLFGGHDARAGAVTAYHRNARNSHECRSCRQRHRRPPRHPVASLPIGGLVPAMTFDMVAGPMHGLPILQGQRQPLGHEGLGRRPQRHFLAVGLDHHLRRRKPAGARAHRGPKARQLPCLPNTQGPDVGAGWKVSAAGAHPSPADFGSIGGEPARIGWVVGCNS